MNNVIQNINIEDILPNNYYHEYQEQELNELVSSIKKYGILEPIILRQKANKYEVVLGNKRYKAATMIGLKTIPAIIKQMDDNEVKEYFEINNNYINTANMNSFSNLNQKNLDVINLSKLNEEYERDDLKMNNNQFNNNINQPTNNIEPTFGGRFFPSLEDEPTNMNFSNINIEQPIPNNQPTNNFIDLTDLNIGGVISQVPQNNIESQSQINNNIPQQIFNNNQVWNNPSTIPVIDNQQPIESITDSNNIINLESLKQNPEMANQPINIDNNFQNVINDFHPHGNITPLQFEQPQINDVITTPNIEQIPNVEQIEIPNYNPQPEIPNHNPQPEISNQFINNPPINNQDTIPQSLNTPIVESVINTPIIESVAPQSNIEPVAPIQEQTQPELSANTIEQKDVLPVINTLKSLAVNLETFGYTIRITDDELPSSYKITIEVEK